MSLITLLNGVSFATIRAAINANFTALAPVVNTIAASGATQALAFTGLQETYYDITLTAACAISLGAGLPGQSIIVVFHGAYAWTGPAGAYYSNGLAPTPQCSATLIDIMQYTVLPNGSILGTPIVLGATAPSVSLAAFSGTIYPASSITVSGNYVGTAPTNLDYAIDGGAYTTLAAGVATISNGAFSFPLTAPAAGSHTVLVRATGTGEVSPAQALTVSAPAVPAAPTLSVASGNALNTITWTDNSANGSAITAHKLYRGTTAGGETLVGTISTASPYSDTGLTNGIAYYYKLSAVNSIGEGAQSTEATATPAAAASGPAHYLNLTGASGTSASTPITGGTGDTSRQASLIDYRVWINFSSYVSQSIIGVTTVSVNGGNSLYLDQNGYPSIAAANNNAPSAYFSSATATLASASPSATRGIWLRVVAVLNPAAKTDISGVSFAGGTTTFFTAPDNGSGSPGTWTQLGSVVSSGYSYAKGVSTGTISIGGNTTYGGVPTGKVYKVTLWDVDYSTTVPALNPDFTAQTTGVTSFTDSAGATWTINSPATEV